jgi:uncharacterized membrane protein YedE/YeeE
MYWEWKRSGLALAGIFLLAFVLVKPIGVSTQFVILDGIIAKQFEPDLVKVDESAKSGFSSSNAYLNKSGGKYAKSVAEPINYSFLFVLSMLLGGLLGRLWQKKSGGSALKQVPIYHSARFGETPTSRYLLSFVGGAIVLFGARLAGGCTSGHMMSGMMQTALSGYIFAAATFLVAIPTAALIYSKSRRN